MNLRHLMALVFAASLLGGCATVPNNQTAGDACPPVQEGAVGPDLNAKVAHELQELGEGDLVTAKEGDNCPAPDEAVTYDIPITINQQVEYFLDYFQNKIPKHFHVWLERSGRYAPQMRQILKEYGLPEDLVYLAMIESGFSCRAYSPAHAVGPWQFIRGTGSRYGLKIDYWVDERRDPIKATHAAARYLKDLYQRFGTWYLAAAAYNAGEGNVEKALKLTGAEDFWSVTQRRQRYLKQETKQYVPKLIAAAIIAKEPEKYGFSGLDFHDPLAYDTVKVHPGTSLGVLAKLAGIKTKDLRELNPELSRWSTPPADGMYELRIPQGRLAAFQSGYASLSPDDRKARVGGIVVQVRKGDTLGRLAKAHGVSLHDLLAANRKLNPQRLAVGQDIFIPPTDSEQGSSASRTVAAYRSGSSRYNLSPIPEQRRDARKLTHKVKSGDTLWEIARTYNLNWRDILRWNGQHTSRLKPGQQLVLYVPQAKAESKVEVEADDSRPENPTVYMVRRGDTLWQISRRFGVSTRDLRRWNSLSSTRLNPGDRLVVRK